MSLRGLGLTLGLICLPCMVWAASAYDSGGDGVVMNIIGNADRAAYHGRYSEAIADDNRALALMPSFGVAYLSRAFHFMDAGRWPEASVDFDRVIAMHPDDMAVAMEHARLTLLRGDPATAVAEVKRALKLPLYSNWHQPVEAGTYESGSSGRFQVTGHMESTALETASIAEQLLHQDDASLADMQRMLKLETVHPEYILSEYCFAAAMSGLLQSAELTCQAAIDANAHDIGEYDSLGFTHLRMKQWGKAIADYNKALVGRPDLTTALYGRGLARRAIGDTAGARADIEAAKSGEPDIAGIMKRLGAPDI